MYDRIELINNNSYGAPELKKVYQVYALKGFIIAVTFHLFLIAVYMLVGYINEAKSKDIPVNQNRNFKIVELDIPPSLDDKDIPDVKDEIIQKVKDLSALNPVPTRKDLADDVILKTQIELNQLDNNVSRDGDSVITVSNLNDVNIKNDIIDNNIKKDINDVQPDKTYKDFEVEKPPECLNLSTVKNQMQYPEIAVESGQEGRVTVSVLVGTDGSVIKVGSLKGPDIFYDEVKDKVKNLQFTPGLQNSTPVKVWVSVPFQFKLK